MLLIRGLEGVNMVWELAKDRSYFNDRWRVSKVVVHCF